MFYHFVLKICKIQAGTYQFGIECYDICPHGTFQKGEKCDESEIHCKECTSIPTKCTDCVEWKYLINN